MSNPKGLKHARQVMAMIERAQRTLVEEIAKLELAIRVEQRDTNSRLDRQCPACSGDDPLCPCGCHITEDLTTRADPGGEPIMHHRHGQHGWHFHAHADQHQQPIDEEIFPMGAVYAYPAPPPMGVTLVAPSGFQWFHEEHDTYVCLEDPTLRRSWDVLIKTAGVLRVIPRGEAEVVGTLYGPAEPCPYPGCDLVAKHDGGHIGPDGPISPNYTPIPDSDWAARVCTCGHPAAHRPGCPRHVTPSDIYAWLGPTDTPTPEWMERDQTDYYQLDRPEPEEL